MAKLHTAQQKLIELLEANITDPLTVRQLQEELGASSPSVVHHHLQQLEKKGYLRRNPCDPKDYHVLSSDPDKKITYVNLYGLACCGHNGTILEGEPIERVPIASKILGFSSADAFMVKAKGDSMEPKINDGDLVIVKKTSSPRDDDIVVCINEGEALIKKIKFDSSKNIVILSSINTRYPPFIVDKSSFKVEGVVKGVLHYF